jgi:hypothetical protein
MCKRCKRLGESVWETKKFLCNGVAFNAEVSFYLTLTGTSIVALSMFDSAFIACSALIVPPRTMVTFLPVAAMAIAASNFV